MKLSEYVKKLAELNLDAIDVDVGVSWDANDNIVISENSPNRIKFIMKLEQLEEKKEG